MKRGIFLLLCSTFICLSGCDINSSQKYGVENNSTTENKSETIEANKLANRFFFEEEQAKQQSQDCIYEITGTYEQGVYQSIYIKTDIKYSDNEKYVIQFIFDDTAYSIVPEQIENGDTITLKGRFKEYINGNIILEESEYISYEEKEGDYSIHIPAQNEMEDEYIYESEIGNNDKEVVAEVVVMSLEEKLKQTSETNYKIKYDETSNCYIINFWQDGLSANLLLSKDSEGWNTLIDEVKDLSISVQEYIERFDEEATSKLNILNDVNRDRILLSIIDGVVLLDAMADINQSEKAETYESSLGMKNALNSAKSYIDFSGFSYYGLIEQLEYEQYTHEEAVYGADNCGADWFKEAKESAMSYIDFSDFSYSGLIEQLEYEQYTHEEAVYGADNCGADWYEEAEGCATSYLDSMGFSRQELIDQLLYEGFTNEQVEHAVTAVGY